METLKGKEGEQIKVDIAPSGEQVDIHVSGNDGDKEEVLLRTNEKIEKVEILEDERGEKVEITTEHEEIDVVIHDHHHEPTKEIEVLVNKKPVKFHVQSASGVFIKKEAIAQGVAIQPDFNLFEREENGVLQPVGDDTVVKLRCGQEFRAVAPDDNSRQ